MTDPEKNHYISCILKLDHNRNYINDMGFYWDLGSLKLLGVWARRLVIKIIARGGRLVLVKYGWVG